VVNKCPAPQTPPTRPNHSHYRIWVPKSGFYNQVFNTDSERYGGSNLGNLGGKFTEESGNHGYEHSLDLCLPPHSVLVFSRDEMRSQELGSASLRAHLNT
jgi:1,4-alpha-glucan branching enzyme